MKFQSSPTESNFQKWTTGKQKGSRNKDKNNTHLSKSSDKVAKISGSKSDNCEELVGALDSFRDTNFTCKETRKKYVNALEQNYSNMQKNLSSLGKTLGTDNHIKLVEGRVKSLREYEDNAKISRDKALEEMGKFTLKAKDNEFMKESIYNENRNVRMQKVRELNNVIEAIKDEIQEAKEEEKTIKVNYMGLMDNFESVEKTFYDSKTTFIQTLKLYETELKRLVKEQKRENIEFFSKIEILEGQYKKERDEKYELAAQLLELEKSIKDNVETIDQNEKEIETLKKQNKFLEDLSFVKLGLTDGDDGAFDIAVKSKISPAKVGVGINSAGSSKAEGNKLDFMEKKPFGRKNSINFSLIKDIGTRGKKKEKHVSENWDSVFSSGISEHSPKKGKSSGSRKKITHMMGGKTFSVRNILFGKARQDTPKPAWKHSDEFDWSSDDREIGNNMGRENSQEIPLVRDAAEAEAAPIHPGEEEGRAHYGEEERRAHREEDERRVHREDEERRVHQGEEKRRTHQDEEKRRARQGEEKRRTHQDEEKRRVHQGEEKRWAHQGEEKRRAHQGEEKRHAHQGEEKLRTHQDEEKRRAHQDEEKRRVYQDERVRREAPAMGPNTAALAPDAGTGAPAADRANKSNPVSSGGAGDANDDDDCQTVATISVTTRDSTGGEEPRSDSVERELFNRLETMRALAQLVTMEKMQMITGST